MCTFFVFFKNAWQIWSQIGQFYIFKLEFCKICYSFLVVLEHS